jgi:uncharacterized membrane protein
MERFTYALTVTTALGSGLMAGLFFIFSNTIMAALGRLTPANGIGAMQAINVAILNPVFLLTFMGTAVLSVMLVIAALLGWHAGAGAGWIYSDAALYLIGIIGVTMIVNVPMNNVLIAVEPGSVNGAAFWADYLVKWTRWNHVRTVAGVLATLSFALALR